MDALVNVVDAMDFSNRPNWFVELNDPCDHQRLLLAARRRRIPGRRAHHAEGRAMNGLEFCD